MYSNLYDGKLFTFCFKKERNEIIWFEKMWLSHGPSVKSDRREVVMTNIC